MAAMNLGSPDAHLKLTIAYDGTRVRGWARQPGERTIEGELHAALGRMYRQHQHLVVAGRTDTGVHAHANVVSLAVWGGPSVDRAAEALNTVLPPDIAIVRADQVDPAFHARYSATSRSYRYRIFRRRERSPFEVHRSYWHPKRLEIQKLQAAAAILVGVHDFHAFTPTETQHRVFVREIKDARWIEEGDVLSFEVTADSFLRHMVRTLVGTMLELDPDEIVGLLQGAPRSAAGATAPPGGLYLKHVTYEVG